MLHRGARAWPTRARLPQGNAQTQLLRPDAGRWWPEGSVRGPARHHQLVRRHRAAVARRFRPGHLRPPATRGETDTGDTGLPDAGCLTGSAPSRTEDRPNQHVDRAPPPTSRATSSAQPRANSGDRRSSSKAARPACSSAKVPARSAAPPSARSEVPANRRNWRVGTRSRVLTPRRSRNSRSGTSTAGELSVAGRRTTWRRRTNSIPTPSCGDDRGARVVGRPLTRPALVAPSRQSADPTWTRR